MNHHHESSSRRSAHSNSSALPSFVPAAYFASSYGDDSDEDDDSFGEHVFSDNGVAFIPEAAPIAAAASSASAVAFAVGNAIADEDDDEDAYFAPKTTYRDTHHVFAHGPCDLIFNSDSFLEASALSLPGKAPTFVLEHASKPAKQAPAPTSSSVAVASPQSPSSYGADVPTKQPVGFFCVNPVMPSRAAPGAIMAALQRALEQLDCCEFALEGRWSIRATLLCVAEEVAFTLALSRVGEASYEVDFLRRAGDEALFCELMEHVRSLCADVDDEALPFLAPALDARLDARQEVAGRRFAIKPADARELLAALEREAHADSALALARQLKDWSRHAGNRRLLLADGPAALLAALKRMFADCDEAARFAVFALLQFARDFDAAADAAAALFEGPGDKSALALLLAEVAQRQRDAPCGRFTVAMVEQVQQRLACC